DAFSSFVDEGVDPILLSATERAGWEESLGRAPETEIPAILIDPGIEPDDPDLYATPLTPDNVALPTAAPACAKPTLPAGATSFALEGPAGVAVVNERNEGWNQAMEGESAFTNLGSQTANWSTQEAKSVFETVLKSNDNVVQLVFAQNDE